IPRVNVAVQVALRNGSGIGGVVSLLERAALHLFKPKSFTEKAYRLAYVIYKYGGASTAEIAQRALGLPSVSTIRRHAQIPMIPVCLGYPTSMETSDIIRSIFPHPVSHRIIGSVLMLDEVHCEQRPRYCACNNTILGFCRQHSAAFSLDFNSFDDVKAVFRGLDDGEIHFASEGPGAAHAHGTRPIHISGSCKREDANEHEGLISAVLDGCRATTEIHGTRPYCVASDGESKRGKALNSLTLKHELPSTSKIRPLLEKLPLLNLHCGDDDLTADKDYKHVFKRLRGLLLRDAGINIFGFVLTREHLRRHLLDCGIGAQHVSTLLNPGDYQDVILAVSLLARVMQMKPAVETTDPSMREARNALWFLGEFLGALVKPYTCPDMSLRDQLKSLSTAAHLLFAMYTSARGGLMQVQLYLDVMIMIKNVFFCVAKTQIDDPDAKFWLILLGTDRLEIVFGRMRSMIGNDCNADMLQVRERLTAAAEITAILAEYPEWDTGPRRLHLPALDRQGIILDHGIDHLNPASWRGDVAVRGVSLQTCWVLGSQSARDILNRYERPFDFSAHASIPDVDFLRPFG
ncbi:hypothetical protein EXIGLDRAFT_580605, partial [Exidia glandulosa HHB12029]